MAVPARVVARLQKKPGVRYVTRMKSLGSIVLAVAILAGCSPGRVAAPAPASSLDNGRLIFRTGKDVDGLKITAQEPPLMASCAACHRANGAGGVHLPGGVVSADLRHAALVSHQKPPYTLALLERAISRGVDNTGQPLNAVMPRWKLSKRDLHDVAQYVLTQLK